MYTYVGIFQYIEVTKIFENHQCHVDFFLWIKTMKENKEKKKNDFNT